MAASFSGIGASLDVPECDCSQALKIVLPPPISFEVTLSPPVSFACFQGSHFHTTSHQLRLVTFASQRPKGVGVAGAFTIMCM